jgi:hypothetical protein
MTCVSRLARRLILDFDASKSLKLADVSHFRLMLRDGLILDRYRLAEFAALDNDVPVYRRHSEVVHSDVWRTETNQATRMPEWKDLQW